MPSGICWRRYGVVFFFVCLLGVSGRAPEAAERTFNAGFVRLTAESDAPFPVSVWYPTPVPEQSWPAGPFVIAATQGAPVAEGRFPVVLLSHGSGGSDLGHHDWAEALARHGVMVVAPRHVGDSFDHPEGRGSDVQLVGRPWQAVTALDTVLAHPVLGPAADPERIGAIGYSAGGYTVLALAGARPDFSLWQAHCDAHPEDQTFCPTGAASAAVSLPRITRPGWTLPKETRIKAAVVMAPAAILYDRDGLAGVSVPMRVYRAADDEVARNPWNADVVIQDLPTPPETVTVPGGHYIFLAPPADREAVRASGLYDDSPGVDRTAVHARIADDLITFFRRTLGGDGAG